MGLEEGVGKRGEGCELEGRGFETSQQQIFFSFFFLLGRYKNAFYSHREILKGPQNIHC